MRLGSIVLAVGVLVASPAAATAEDDPMVEEHQGIASDEDSSEQAPAPKNDPKVPDDQEVAYYETEVQEDPEGPLAPDGSRCRGVTANITAYNRAQMWIWKAWMHGRWCFSDGRVRSAAFSKWGTTPWWNNWNFEGITYTVNGGCIGCTYRYQRAGYRFRACFTWYCVNDYAWIGLTLRGNGTAYVTRGFG